MKSFLVLGENCENSLAFIKIQVQVSNCKIISHMPTSYKVKVESFKNKMITWQPGRYG